MTTRAFLLILTLCVLCNACGSDNPVVPRDDDLNPNEVLFPYDGVDLRGTARYWSNDGFMTVNVHFGTERYDPFPQHFQVTSLRVLVNGELTAVDEFNSMIWDEGYSLYAETDLVVEMSDIVDFRIEMTRRHGQKVEKQIRAGASWGWHSDCPTDGSLYAEFTEEATLAQVEGFARSLNTPLTLDAWGESVFMVRVIEGEARELFDALNATPDVRSARPYREDGQLFFRVQFDVGVSRDVSVALMRPFAFEVADEFTRGKTGYLEIPHLVPEGYLLINYVNNQPFVSEAWFYACPTP